MSAQQHEGGRHVISAFDDSRSIDSLDDIEQLSPTNPHRQRPLSIRQSHNCTKEAEKPAPNHAALRSLALSSIIVEGLTAEVFMLREQTQQQQLVIEALHEQLQETRASEESLRIREAELERAFASCTLAIERLTMEQEARLKSAAQVND